VKELSGVAKICDFKYIRVKPPPPCVPAPIDDARAGCSDNGSEHSMGTAAAANQAPVPAALPKACTGKRNKYACAR
jgi:hypothetical protein